MRHVHITALLVLSGLWLACAGPRSGQRSAAEASPELVYESSTLGSSKPEAMLVALHYSGATPAFWNDLLKDWGPPTLAVLPRGPLPRREGFTWFPPEHEKKTLAEKTEDAERMAARVASLIRDLRSAHPEIRRVAVTGFSYGGDLAWFLALRHPDLVDVAVPMGSRLLGDPTPGAPGASRVWVLQGETDAIIDARRTSERVNALKALGVPIDVKVYPGLGHDFSPELISDWRAFLQRELGAGEGG